MRVCVVDPISYTLPYDDSLARSLAGRGHSVDLLAARFQHGAPPEPNGYRFHEVFFTTSASILRYAPRSRLRFLVKGLEYAPNVRRLLRAIEELAPDVVHLQWLGIPRYDRRWLSRLVRRRPVVFTAHDVIPARWEGRPDLWREIFGLVDRVVVHGRGAVERLLELGVDESRVVRIPHPLFPAGADRPLEPPRGSTLLFFGLLRPAKGLDLLLRALPAIAESVPDVRLVVAGDPLQPVEPLQTLAAELGVAERIEWRLRFIEQEEIAALMAAATAVVLPYRRIESSGVLATALGHGRPAVVTDVGSLGDTIREFEAGLVVPPEDTAALAEACVRLLTDQQALSAAFDGVRAANATLTWEAAAEAHERLYEELAAARGR